MLVPRKLPARAKTMWWWHDHTQQATFMKLSDRDEEPSQILCGLAEFVTMYRNRGYEIVNSTPDGRKEIGVDTRP